jgi:hypothetical protein
MARMKGGAQGMKSHPTPVNRIPISNEWLSLEILTSIGGKKFIRRIEPATLALNIPYRPEKL